MPSSIKTTMKAKEFKLLIEAIILSGIIQSSQSKTIVEDVKRAKMTADYLINDES